MAINIFEGARRIALLLGGTAAFGTALVAINKDSYYRATYALAAPDAPIRKTDGSCSSNGHTIYFDHKISSGKEIGVSVCLEPMTFKNKEEVELIPYKTDSGGITWGARPYTPEISTYEKQVKKRFAMTATDEEAAIKEASKKWRSEFAEAMGYLIVGLTIFAAFVWGVGWIVRGFLGIPRGMDKHPDR